MRSKELIRKQFGRIVRDLRKKRGLSLRRAAKQAGISPTYLSRVERGQLDPPSSEKILKIAELIDALPALLLVVAGRTAVVSHSGNGIGGVIVKTPRGHFALQR